MQLPSVIPSKNLGRVTGRLGKQVGSLSEPLEDVGDAGSTLTTIEECLHSTLSIRDLDGFGRCHCNMSLCIVSRCVKLILIQ